jgi:hypothetical protein
VFNIEIGARSLSAEIAGILGKARPGSNQRKIALQPKRRAYIVRQLSGFTNDAASTKLVIAGLARKTCGCNDEESSMDLAY